MTNPLQVATHSARTRRAVPHTPSLHTALSNTSSHAQQADGIVGLGTGELSIIPALWAAGKLQQYVFSLCLSWTGGAMTLGAVDSRLHASSPGAWGAGRGRACGDGGFESGSAQRCVAQTE